MELLPAILYCIVAAIVIAFAGTMFAKQADKPADITGIGEALFGFCWDNFFIFELIDECGIKSIFLSKSRRFKFLYRS